MKKKWQCVLAAVLTAGMVSACGGNNGQTQDGSEERQTQDRADEGQTQDGTDEGQTAESEARDGNQDEGIVLKDFDAESHVTLNEYKGMSITLTKPSVEEEEVDAYISGMVSTLGGTKGAAITDRAVEEGDTVNINYAGTLDGVAFEGGTDDSEEGTNLGIGSHSFIEGFEEGLIGAMPGDTVELNLTFPEDYDEEMAGKSVVFTVTVNGIAPAELSEELLPFLDGEPATMEEYRQSVYDSLMEEKQEEFDYYYDADVENAIIGKLLEECTYTDIPEELKIKYRTNLFNNLSAAAGMYGLDLETYAAYAYGMDYETFEQFLDGWAEMSAQQAVTFQAIANKENLNVGDEELDEELETYAADNGYESPEEFLNGGSKEEYREYLMFANVLDFLRENAQITVE